MCTKINHLNRTSKNNFFLSVLRRLLLRGWGKRGVKAIFVHISEREFSKPLKKSRTKFTYDLLYSISIMVVKHLGTLRDERNKLLTKKKRNVGGYTFDNQSERGFYIFRRIILAPYERSLPSSCYYLTTMNYNDPDVCPNTSVVRQRSQRLVRCGRHSSECFAGVFFVLVRS